MNGTEDLLRTTLGEHSTDVRVSVTDLADHAIARDGRNRRRELTAMAGAAALALAVAIPVALTLGGTPRTAPVPAGTSTSVVSTTVTTAPTTPAETSHPPTETSNPATSSTTPESVPYAELAHAWSAGDQLHLGDGRTIQLERGTRVSGFAVLANGGVILQSSMPTPRALAEVEILDPDGHPIKQIWEGNGNVDWRVSTDGTRVVLADSDQRLTVYDQGANVLARRADERPVRALVGDKAYLSEDSTADLPSLEWDVVTDKTRELPGGISAVSADGTRATATWQPKGTDGYNVCWAVLDLTADGTELDRHCDSSFRPFRLSPDGSLLLGQHYVDGGYVSSLAVRAVSTGELILGGTKPDWMLGWGLRFAPDGKSVLVSKSTETDTEELRGWLGELQDCTLDGKCTTLLPEQRGTPGQGYYVVAR